MSGSVGARRSKKTQLAKEVKDMAPENVKELRNAAFFKVLELFREDPEYIDIALRSPRLLGTEVALPNEAPHRQSCKLAHIVAVHHPEESMYLINALKQDSSAYLPILTKDKAQDMTVAAMLSYKAIQRDMEAAFEKVQIVGLIPVSPYGGFAIGIGPDESSAGSGLRAKLVGALRDSPGMQQVFASGGVDHISVAHIWARDEYLAPAMIDLIEGKPFFGSTLGLRTGDGMAVASFLARGCDTTDRLTDALVRSSADTAREVLTIRTETEHGDGVYLIHSLLTHGHTAKKLNKFFRKERSLSDILDLEVVASDGGAIKADDLLRVHLRRLM